MEDGGCAVLFRSPRSRLLGVPNALLGVALYALLAIGLVLHWPPLLLFVMTLPAVAMSVFLAYSLLSRNLQCRICWTGHVANGVLAVLLAANAFHLKVEATRVYAAEMTPAARGFRLQAEDPDALYKERETISRAQQAEQIWADRLAKDPKDFVSAWKLAKARYWLGTHAEEKSRKAYLEAGIAAGRAAMAAAADKPEGHFWVAANMIDCAPVAIVCIPEAQALLIVCAGTVSGTPAFIPTWRAGFGPDPAWRPWPISTSSTSAGETPARSSAALAAAAPSSAGWTFLSEPP